MTPYFQIEGSKMNKSTFSILPCFVLFFACFTFPGTASADPQPVDGEIPDDTIAAPVFELVQRGIAHPGSALHEWLSSEFSIYQSTFPIEYKFKFGGVPEDPGLLDIEMFAAEQVSKSKSMAAASKSGGASTIQSGPAVPEPPGNPGNTIGDEWTYHSDCWNAGIGYGFAEVTAVYHWEYTTDTDNNGEYDANPEWVLQSVEFTFFYPNQPPPSCV